MEIAVVLPQLDLGGDCRWLLVRPGEVSGGDIDAPRWRSRRGIRDHVGGMLTSNRAL